MRFFIVLFLIVILLFLGIQAYRLQDKKADLLGQIGKLDERADALITENKKFNDNLEYIGGTANAAKELQSKFNYRKPDEQMFILVPTP